MIVVLEINKHLFDRCPVSGIAFENIVLDRVAFITCHHTNYNLFAITTVVTAIAVLTE